MYKHVGSIDDETLSKLKELADKAVWKVVKDDERDYQTSHVDVQNLLPRWSSFHAAFFLRLKPHGKVHRHVDRGNEWSTYHVVVQTNDDAVSFMSDVPYNLREGEVYWADRKVPHWSVNEGDTDRIHLLCEVHE